MQIFCLLSNAGIPATEHPVSDIGALEEAVKSLAMKLELRVQGDSLLAGMHKDVDVSTTCIYICAHSGSSGWQCF